MNMRAASNDSLNQARGWFSSCPAFTRFLIFFCGGLGILNIPFSTSEYLANKPLYTIGQNEYYRLLFSPFVFLTLLSLLFGMFAYLPLCAKKEREYGTLKTILDFFWKNLIINLLYIAFAYLLSFVVSWFSKHGCYGLWQIFFAYLVERCLEDPDGVTPVFCLPIQLKNKYYPVGLFVLFSFLSGSVLVDLFVSMLVGFLHFKFLNRPYFAFLNDHRMGAWEDSFVFSWLKKVPGFVSHNVAIGTTPGSGSTTQGSGNQANNRGQNQPQAANFGGKGVSVGEGPSGKKSPSKLSNYQQLDEDSGRDLEFGGESNQ